MNRRITPIGPEQGALQGDLLTSTPAEAAGGTHGAAGSEVWDELVRSIDGRKERMLKLRRLLHATPEPSGHERETTKTIAEILHEQGLKPNLLKDGIGLTVDVFPGDGRTSADALDSDVSQKRGSGQSGVIALRSELDCVQVNDDKQVPYASTRDGLCHACGHDAHTTMVLGAILAAHDCREHLSGLGFRHGLRAIFQPSEETATGARSVIQQGAINDVAAMIALHVDPMMDTGTLGVRTGAITAAFKSFRIAIKGRGGHSARPHEAIDPIPAATEIVGLLYQLAPRSIDSRHPLALTVASITAGASYNAIPDHAVIQGTVRTMRQEDTEAVRKRMEQVARGVAEATGCSVDVQFVNWCPATKNDPVLVDRLAAAGRRVLGTDRVVWIDQPSMGGEDFAFYQELIPGAIVRLGAGHPDKPLASRRPLHSSQFDIDERCIPLGSEILLAAALELALSYPAP